ncbi:Endonuclease V [Planctomycetes bacterium Pan216]|uniref:Endonuclease V n=1 Tax=Kolteria novifilia TaxID=2527975 RepID=A0A518B9B1_9BACT|nr:Endonuclease V [Planctomycetes bacterium Pan216]
MRFRKLHDWDLTPKEAVALQRQLVSQVVLNRPDKRPPQLIAGVDASYPRFSNRITAGVVVCHRDDWSIVESSYAVLDSPFPYVPGLLSFRELPGLLEAFKGLKTRPDAIIVDGQGRAHPRRFGIGCHLGLWLDIPTIGCGKTRLCGEFAEPSNERGGRSDLIDKEEVIGEVLRTRTGVKPVYASIGHKFDLVSAVDLLLDCAPRYRLPEPIRLAHHFVNESRLASTEDA